MQIYVDYLNEMPEGSDISGMPSEDEIKMWAKAAFDEASFSEDCSFSVTFVSNEEIAELNHEFRDKNKPTNILSFPFELDEDMPPELLEDLDADGQGRFLGDLVIALDVMRQEAIEQHKTLTEHCAHLIIHGCLHLLGYDHIEDNEAIVMESLEIKAVTALGYKDPYLIHED